METATLHWGNATDGNDRPIERISGIMVSDCDRHASGMCVLTTDYITLVVYRVIARVDMEIQYDFDDVDVLTYGNATKLFLTTCRNQL